MVYSCKNEVDKARNDRDKYKKERDRCNSELKKSNSQLVTIKKEKGEIQGKLQETQSQLNTMITNYDTIKTQYQLIQKLLDVEKQNVSNCNDAYNKQTTEVGYLKNHNLVNEYFSMKEGLTTQESSAINTELKNIDRISYTAVLDQNSQLSSEIEKYRNEYSTDDQKINYEEQTIYLLLKANHFLKWIYFFFFIIFLYFLYYTTKYSIYVKIVLLIVIAIYPFVIYPIERRFYEFFNYIRSFLYPL
jgi:predicted nuclease with TOPRIM domain